MLRRCALLKSLPALAIVLLSGCTTTDVIVTRPGGGAPWPCPPAPTRPRLLTDASGGLSREAFVALALYVVDLERAHAICAESVRQIERLDAR